MTDISKNPETAYDRIERDASELKLNFSKEELAVLADENHYSDKDISLIEEMFDYLVKRRKESIAETCLKLSRLPRTNPKTFDNFDFNRLHGNDVEKLKALRNLAPLYEHHNIAFIGSQGIGNYAKQLIM